MSGSYPYFRIRQNGGLNADIIEVFLDELLPPGKLYVLLKTGTQRTEVPGVRQTAVDFRTLENIAGCLKMCNDLFKSNNVLSLFSFHLRV